MGPYKLAVHILLILSVFNFLTPLAVPVPVQEVREACAEPDGGEDLIIMSWKRAEKVDHPWSWHHGLTQASPRSSSESDYLSTSLQHPPGSPPMTNYASRGYEDSETTDPIQQPASSSGGTELPWYSKGEMPAGRPPSRYTAGGTNRPSYSPGPGTTSRILPGTSVRTKTNKWLPSAEIEPVPSSSDEIRRPPYAFGGTRLPWYSSELGSTSKIPQVSSARTKTYKWAPIPDSPQASSVRTKTNKWVTTAEIPPASTVPTSEIETTSSSSASSSSGWSSSGEITPASPNKVLSPSEHITPASSSKVLPSSEEISPASSNKVLLPSEQITPASSSNVPPPSEHITPGSSSKVLPPSEEITPASSSKVPPPSEQITPGSSSNDLPSSEQISPASSSKAISSPEQEGYVAQTPTEQSKPQSGSLLGKSKKILSKSKNKLVGMSKSLVKEMVDNPKLQIRISATASGAVKMT